LKKKYFDYTLKNWLRTSGLYAFIDVFAIKICVSIK
jgi:hypothetical protein